LPPAMLIAKSAPSTKRKSVVIGELPALTRDVLRDVMHRLSSDTLWTWLGLLQNGNSSVELMSAPSIEFK
jgi:hypothetical protein